MTPAEFIRKWKAVQLNEKAAAQEHFLDICAMLRQPTPATADPVGTHYTFERGARKQDGGEGFSFVAVDILVSLRCAAKRPAPFWCPAKPGAGQMPCGIVRDDRDGLAGLPNCTLTKRRGTAPQYFTLGGMLLETPPPRIAKPRGAQFPRFEPRSVCW
jgi:hypothetical protein